jgi:RND superfamily putative drug exporter
VEQLFWYRSTKFVIGHAIPVALVSITLLVVLGLPVLSVKWGFPDDRVLPASASSRQIGDGMRTDFAVDSTTNVTAVIPDISGLPPRELERYAGEVSKVPGVSFVSPAVVKDGRAYLTIGSTAPLASQTSESQLDQLHAVSGPGGREVLFTGTAQITRDSSQAVTGRMPMVLAVIAAITFVLLFLLTGSVVLPLKALLLNVLSLTAAFGALVWIFQEGHFGAFGTTPTGTLAANMPVLLFCIAFGLSMDYEVFLISRIREFWLESPQGGRDDRGSIAPRVRSDESVALGLARTGRVVTAAALLMSISFAALIAAQVAFMRMFGVGLTLAVLVDATLVRMLLVPAFMHVMGRANWWAPKPLARLHNRFGLSESGALGVTTEAGERVDSRS